MDTATVPAPYGAANACAFAAALEAATFTDRFASQMRAAHQRNLSRLIAMPAPDIAALAAKMGLADPMDLEHHAAVTVDARRLAAMPMGLEVSEARALLAFIDAAGPGAPHLEIVVAIADRLEAMLAAQPRH